MAFILDAHSSHDLLDTQHTRHKERARLFQSERIEIEPRRRSRFGLKQVMQVRERKIHSLGQFIKREVSMKLLFHQVHDDLYSRVHPFY